MSGYIRNRLGCVLVFMATHALLACQADDRGAPSGLPSEADREGEGDRNEDRTDGAPGEPKLDAGLAAPDARSRDGGARDAEFVAPEPFDGDVSDTPGAHGDDGEGGARESVDAAGVSDAGAEPIMTCLPAATLAPGEVSRTLQVDGVSRTYLLHVPPGYSGEKPVPLVLDWHGLLLDAAAQRGSSGYAELSDKEGFVVAFPNGIDNAWNVGPCCTQSRDVDDVAFARALVAEIARLGCIDSKRVYSTGFSNGGGMTMQLACNAADVFAAVAPAAFDLLAEDEQPCHPSRPISIITFRGKSDLIVPYAGGASNPPNGLPTTIHFRGAQATFDFWKEANGCSGSPTMANGCVTYSDCDDGVQTTLCTQEGLLTGNHLPGDPELGWATMKQYTLP